MPVNRKHPVSQAPCQGERVQKPILIQSSNQTAVPRTINPCQRKGDVPGTQRNGWDRLVVVVGGITSTQGTWECRVQGEGLETSSSETATHTEVIDLDDGCG